MRLRHGLIAKEQAQSRRFHKTADIRTEPLQKSSRIETFFRRVGAYAVSVVLSAALLFSGCKEEEQNLDYIIYFKKPDKDVLYNEAGYRPILVGENQVLVTFKRDVGEEDRTKVQDWLAQRGASHIGYISGVETYQYELKKGDSLVEVLASLRKMDAVWVASPNAKFTMLKDPNPNLQGTLYDGHWWIDRIKLRQAWDITTGSENIPIGIVDKGFVKNAAGYGHLDSKEISYGVTCIKEKGDAEHHSVFFEFYKPEHRPDDCVELPADNSHGIEVAAIAGANGNEGKAGVGVAWNNHMISVDLGSLYGTDESGAIELAILMGAKVINVSRGIPGDAKEHERFRDYILPAVEKAAKSNVLVVLAAGNDGIKNDDNWLSSNIPSTKTEYFKSNVLSVGAADPWNNPACTTDILTIALTKEEERCKCPKSFGDWETDKQYAHYMTAEGKTVELSAPGYWVRIAREGGAFGFSGGTSLSAPMVTGAAALIWSIRPDLTAPQVKSILLKTAQKGLDKCHDIGEGILDVEAALKMAKDFKTTTFIWKTTSTIIIADAIELNDGNYGILESSSDQSKAEESSLKIVNSSGKLVATYTVDVTTSNDYMNRVLYTTDSEFIVLAQSGGKSYILKLDKDGKEVWKSTLTSKYYKSEPFNTSYLADIQQTTDKNYVAVGSGSSPSGNAISGYIWVMTIDKDGKKALDAYFGDVAAHNSVTINLGSSVQQTADGGFIIAGTAGTLAGQSGALLLKTDNKLKEERHEIYGNDGIKQASAVRQTSDGEYIFCGHGNGTGSSLENHLRIIKVDKYGTVAWDSNKTLGSDSSIGSDSSAASVSQTTDGRYIVGGRYKEKTDVWYKGFVYKLKSDGTLEWKKLLTDSNGAVVSLVQTSDYGYLIAMEKAVIKTDSNGEVK